MKTVSDLFKRYSSVSKNNRIVEISVGVGSNLGNFPTDFNFYTKEQVLGFTMDTRLVSGETFSIGNAIPKKLTLNLKTTDTILTGNVIVIDMRYGGSLGYTEWVNIGIFYADKPEYKYGVYKLTCYDGLIYFNKKYNSALTFPAKPSDVFNEIVSHTGLNLNIMPSTLVDVQVLDQDFTITAPTDTTTMLDKLKEIAILCCGNVVIYDQLHVSAENDNLVYYSNLDFLVQYGRTNLTTWQDGNDYTPVSASDIFGIINKTGERKLYTRFLCYKDEKTYFEPGGSPGNTGTEENTLAVTSLNASEKLAELMYICMNTLNYIPLEFNWIGYLYLDVGDFIQVSLRDKTYYNTFILQNTITYDGAFSFSTKSPATSSTESSYNNSGGTGYSGGGGSITSIDASKVNIQDAANNFASTNVEGALSELFTFASNAKKLIVDALIKKWVQASYSDSFAVLAKDIDNLLTIPILFVKEVYTGISLTAPTITINTITDSISASIQTPIQSTISETYTGITIDTSNTSLTVIPITENVTITKS
ncbi:MAG: hypothetical protein Q8900_13520 [Bacillota bacterium]|nr:hypothetical protein [Bacillota bacterium]